MRYTRTGYLVEGAGSIPRGLTRISRALIMMTTGVGGREKIRTGRELPPLMIRTIREWNLKIPLIIKIIILRIRKVGKVRVHMEHLHLTIHHPLRILLPPQKREQVRLTIAAIDPEAYTTVHGIHSGPCAICGAKWVHYTEKQPPGDKGEEKTSRVLCQKCYSKAVARVSLSFITLPGTLNTARMVEADKDYGRCPICNLGGISWYDNETKTGICSTCYSREQARNGGGQ